MNLPGLQGLRDWYAGREPREQRVLLFGGIAALAIVVLGGLWQVRSTVTQLEARVDRKRQDLQFMQAASAEIIAAGPALANRIVGAPAEPLVVVLDRAARESGLIDALGSSEAVGAGLRVRFNAASFDALVGLVTRLSQQNGIVVDSATIERAGAAGTVNATLTLQPSSPP